MIVRPPPVSPLQARFPGSVGVLMSGVLIAGMTACGGGGGGSGGGSPATRASFETSEYFASPGLELVDASLAYARGATGRGVVVAVIDTGIDVDHPELADAIASSSIDIVSGSGATIDDSDGHGTSVSGVIAARRNGAISHGVAFDADIMAIRADALGSCASGCSFAEEDVAAATDHAVDRGARIINYSLGGGSSIGSRLKSSLAAAADSGTVLVFAAGNSGSASPTFPARAADDPVILGHAIAVGSVDGDGTISDFSNRGGSAADVFLVAPGEGIVAPAAGGGRRTVSGTSFAAPHVAGAAALLLDISPFLTSEEVVDLLLTSAQDLGEPGVDPVYGHGLLDVAEALRPQGGLSVPLGERVEQDRVALAESGLVLGQAVGLPEVLPPVVAIDGYARPYSVASGSLMRRRSGTFDLQRQLEPGPAVGTMGLALTDDLHAAFTMSDDGDERRWGGGPDERGPSGDVALALNAASGLSLMFGSTRFAGWDGGVADRAGLMTSTRFAPQHLALAQGDSIRIRQALGGGTSVALFAGQGAGEADGNRASGVDVALDITGGGRLALGVGRLEEDDGPLRSRGSGALALGASRTDFLTIGGSWPVTASSMVFGSLGWGRTRVDEAQGLLRDFSTLESIGAGLGVSHAGVLRAADRLVLAVAQPLRVEAGEAVLDRPVARTVGGRIIRERTRLDVEPDGREISLEAAYETPFAAGRSLAVNWLTRLEPDHRRDAGPWHGATITVRQRL